MLEIGDRWRIERGPALISAKATAQLLGDPTADHYVEGAPDALGQPIKIGKPMAYLDWKSDQPVFYLYRLDPISRAERRAGDEREEIWREIGSFPTEEAALAVVMES